MAQYNFYKLLHPSLTLQKSVFINEVAYQKGQSYPFERVVRIPQIQRDYAQGRQNEDVRGKRVAFLKEILDTIYSPSGKLLPVDFIYGYIRKSGGSPISSGQLTINDIISTDLAFEPLDGQQRLTTLFVLYWLFGRREELIDSRTKTSTEPGLSLFTYQTRSSSEQFCNELVHHDATIIVQQWQREHSIVKYLNIMIEKKWKNAAGATDYQLKMKNPLHPMPTFSEYFRQLEWFNWNWNNDATIISMLNVMETALELIDQFGYTYIEGVKLSANLDNIVFDLLDDLNCNGEKLFVKMNARGKFLSSFDLMKSKLEEELELQSTAAKLHEDWSTRVDGNWIDYCWDKNSTLSGNDRALATETQLECIIKRIICHGFIGKRKLIHNDKDTNVINSADFGQELINMVYSHGKKKDDIIGKYADYAYLQRKILAKNPAATPLQKIDYQQILDDIDCLFFQDSNKLWYDVSDILYNNGYICFLNPSKTFLSHYFDAETDMGYQECLLLHALLKFCRVNSATLIASNMNLQKDLMGWMNYVQHVSLNTNRNVSFDTPDRFDEGVNLIDGWFDAWIGRQKIAPGISFEEYLAKNLNVGSNEPDRAREENLKAKLVLGVGPQNSGSNKSWQTFFKQYEQNSFLCGQLIAPLEWACKSSGVYDETNFNTYAAKLIELLSQAQNNIEIDALSIQAMLCICDYRNSVDFGSLHSYDRNAGFGLGWKQYLRTKSNGIYGKVVKLLIDEWVKSGNPDLKLFLDNFVVTKRVSITDWRKTLLAIPVPGFDKILKEVSISRKTRNVDSSTGIPIMVVASTNGGQRKYDLLLALWRWDKSLWGTDVTSVEMLSSGATSITKLRFNCKNGDEVIVESLHDSNYRLTYPTGTNTYQMPQLENQLRLLNCIK